MTFDNTMHILCNGSRRELEKEISLAQLLEELKLPADSVVAEVNRQIVQPEQYGTHFLADGDQVELIRFVGGG